uniref:Uncharacterized protein n=1 Tax=Chromera velia CCMP2878 TaxID=1169474 RepID=A0A0G4FVD5_9ALVE|mmetsp:Transcript_45740/g.90091  ORF Transcript_45740/g.90091 Transcript_45740/m.90091 type:complete len:155 (+) Transcript_45740:211-675(+)|eukprot:Cvel_18965.t1-p1 / transcript=Cvel_18965.t1 / gene=Cvel_18965 / organism=Chromera_velia_CCMP2878 / gene_product=Protein PROTON GRADIENT REGULATION 5, chloroplastic, putative / transcript_product=Protein PROTON GRADIENT REGULATION 5, chloroplastic, putative / location=Cvel_scaffold1603:18287-19482(+) / protein_length=154 / sequence_SO=supercontig / SO=protein_coding / is_pseudo=false
MVFLRCAGFVCITLLLCVEAGLAFQPNSWSSSPSLLRRRSLSPTGRANFFDGDSPSPVRSLLLAEETATEAPPAAPKKKVKRGKQAKFGLFSPAVIVGKLVLGEKRLNKIRGKIIALHSQVITQFCEYAGTQQQMRNKLIRFAKTTGDNFGMLV